MTRFPCRTLLCIPVAALMTACAVDPAAGPAVRADLEGRSGSQVSGLVTFAPMGDKVQVAARVRGLTPGQHGFHIHEVGDCSAPDATSAKGHFNPGSKPHGNVGTADHHAGDLPNLVADADGNAKYLMEVAGLNLTTGPDGIVGRSVVIHADPDDYKTQPAGNSGKRVACGVIQVR